MRDLAGANALITGASGGIGPYLARALARAGANVAVSGRRADALEALVAELAGVGVHAESVPADLADPANAERLIDRSESALGPIDVLVNNAGVARDALAARGRGRTSSISQAWAGPSDAAAFARTRKSAPAQATASSASAGAARASSEEAAQRRDRQPRSGRSCVVACGAGPARAKSRRTRR